MFFSALPVAQYSLEIRDLNRKQVHDRVKIMNLVRSQYETLRSQFGKSKGSSKPLELVGKGGSGCGKKGGKAHGGQKRSGKGKEGNGNANSNGEAGKAKVSMRCFRCNVATQSRDSCTAKLCDRCGGRGDEVNKCASPADIDEPPAEAILAMVGDPGDDAVKTKAFRRYSSLSPAVGV